MVLHSFLAIRGTLLFPLVGSGLFLMTMPWPGRIATVTRAERIHPRFIIAEHTKYMTEIIYINGTGQEIYKQVEETNEVTYSSIIDIFYEKFVSLAFDYADSRIFFNNAATKKIHGISLEGDNQDPWVIYNGTSAVVEGITVDWLTNNTYWTDAVYKWIKVAHIDGYTKSLTTTDLDHPSGITCNPITGYLYWSDIGRMNKIERSTLAGEERTVLLDENSLGFLSKPTALTMDHQDNILYWVDNFYSYIVSFDLNDKNAYPNYLKQVVTSGDLFSFDIDPEFGFFVTDIQDNYLHIVPLDLRKTTETIIWQHEVPNGVIFYSDINQPEQSAPCESAGCDQLCASDPSGYRCFCTYGYRLNLDEKTCEPDGSIIYGHDMVFSMEDSGLCTFQPNIGHRQTPERRCFSDYVAEELDLDVYALYVFTVEKTGNVTKIWRLRLETTVPRDYIMQLPSSDVRGIAVDWIASNLYITDAERREILISSLEGSYLTTLVGNDISRPTAIAVHAPKQYLFWTDTGPNPRIERSDLSGRKDRRLLVNTRIQSPTHLVIDMPNDRIYWADGETLLIESMQLDGQKREIFYNYSGLTDNPLFHFTGLAIFQDLLYASETGKTLRVFDKTSNDLIQSINYPGEIKTMKFFHESLQPLAEDPCAVLNEECDEICINTKYGAECVCSTASCTPVYRCPLTIENGKLLAGCDNRDGHSCDFMCNIGYLSVTDEPVTCMEPGEWSIGSQELCRLPPRCPLNIPNGQMSDSCDNKIGESCNYTCNDGYRPTTMDSVTCGDAGEWSIPSEDLCVILHCFSGPCQNDGKCTDMDDGFNCTCSLQWHGDVCDQQMSGTTGGSNGVVIAVTLVVIVLVITAVVVLVLFRRRILQKSRDSDTPFDDVLVRNKSVENAYSGASTAPQASAPAAPTAPPASAPAAPMQSGRQTILELKVRSVEGPPHQWNVVADDPNVKVVFSADHHPRMVATTNHNDHTYDVPSNTSNHDDYATPVEMFPNGIENKGMDERDGDGTSDYTLMNSQMAHDEYMTLALMSNDRTNEDKLGQPSEGETSPPSINDSSSYTEIDNSSPEYFVAIE